jgi:hypothetical protein
MKDKKKLIDTISKAIGMKVGSVDDEWKTPAVVYGEEDGTQYLYTRAESKSQAVELRDKVKGAINVAQSIIEHNPAVNGTDSEAFKTW